MQLQRRSVRSNYSSSYGTEAVVQKDLNLLCLKLSQGGRAIFDFLPAPEIS